MLQDAQEPRFRELLMSWLSCCLPEKRFPSGTFRSRALSSLPAPCYFRPSRPENPRRLIFQHRAGIRHLSPLFFVFAGKLLVGFRGTVYACPPFHAGSHRILFSIAGISSGARRNAEDVGSQRPSSVGSSHTRILEGIAPERRLNG